MKIKAQIFKLFLPLVLLLMATTPLFALKKITVSSEAQFLEALGSDRVITIARDTKLNLSKILEYEDLCQQAGISWIDEGEEITGKNDTKYAEDIFDGRQLILYGMKNLTIIGESGAELVVEPRYSYVLTFKNCRNVVLRNLTIGHTMGGYCMGGVVYLSYCKGVKVESCDLYGCGTYGLEAYNSANVRFARSIIRDCTYGIMILKDVFNVDFIDCDFYRNQEFTLVDIGKNSVNVEFFNCRFAQNKGTLFSLRSYVSLESCEIKHLMPLDPSIDGSADYFQAKNTTWDEVNEELQPRDIGPK